MYEFMNIIYIYGLAFRQPKFECGCCEMLFFRVCGVRQNLYVYSLYRNPDLDDLFFDCLLASMAAVQAEDVRAAFLFVGDLNGHFREDNLWNTEGLHFRWIYFRLATIINLIIAIINVSRRFYKALQTYK